MSTPRKIVKNLLMYRYNQLPKAIENARKLGFKDGAALFPQVTSNGEECHSEWEITFEEIHRNNIIVYAILQHAAITGTTDYILHYGLEVMIAVSRFWSQRVTFSQFKQRYVILGVTGQQLVHQLLLCPLPHDDSALPGRNCPKTSRRLCTDMPNDSFGL